MWRPECRVAELVVRQNTVSDLNFENIINGIASGEYTRKIGSQFGSVWGFDGLLAAEATPEQYAAFGASSEIQLCHSQEIDWLDRKWSVVLAYRGKALKQVSVYSDSIGPGGAQPKLDLTWSSSSEGFGVVQKLTSVNPEAFHSK